MTTHQLKQEAVKALDQVPGEVLAELLAYLYSLQGKDEASIHRARHVRTIFTEDSALLKALAE